MLLIPKIIQAKLNRYGTCNAEKQKKNHHLTSVHGTETDSLFCPRVQPVYYSTVAKYCS